MPASSASRGLVKIDRLALDQKLAVARLVHARQGLDQRRLAGAVVAEQAHDLAGAHRHRDARQRDDRAEMLDEIADVDERCRRVAISVLPSLSCG